MRRWPWCRNRVDDDVDVSPGGPGHLLGEAVDVVDDRHDIVRPGTASPVDRRPGPADRDDPGGHEEPRGTDGHLTDGATRPQHDDPLNPTEPGTTGERHPRGDGRQAESRDRHVR